MKSSLRRLLCLPLVALLPFAFSWETTGIGNASDGLGPLEACGPADQAAIFAAGQAVSCEDLGPTDTLVRLALPNDSYLDMTPREVTVRRCVGSCNLSHKGAPSCVPLDVAAKEVKVLLRTNRPPSRGVVFYECAVAVVEEHLSCGCGCPVSPETCEDGPKTFIEEECKCDCADSEARKTCIEQNKAWDTNTCSCYCLPQEQWPSCPTGYTFDYRPHGECACVNHATTASLVLELMVMIVIVGLVFITYKLCSCYKSKTGLFQAMYNQASEDRRFSLFYQHDPVAPTRNAPSRPSELFSVSRVKEFFVDLVHHLDHFGDHQSSGSRQRGSDTAPRGN